MSQVAMTAAIHWLCTAALVFIVIHVPKLRQQNAARSALHTPGGGGFGSECTDEPCL